MARRFRVASHIDARYPLPITYLKATGINIDGASYFVGMPSAYEQLARGLPAFLEFDRNETQLFAP